MGNERTRVAFLAAAIAACIGALAFIGSDVLWLVPLGSRIAHGRLPDSIFYATAPTSHWHDVPAGAELVVWAAYHSFGGLRGLAVAQAVAVAVAFATLAYGLRRRTTDATVLLACTLVLAGSLTAVLVVNASLFSLALFPVLLLLLERESDSPSRRIWLAVPLLAFWANLHGEVLAGFALLACYLLFDRAFRAPWAALATLVASAASLFVNPALWRTPHYYSGVLHTVVAEQGKGLWAPLGFGPLDVIEIMAALALLGLVVRGGFPVRRWETVALLGLTAEAIHVARSGPWLLFALAYPATRGVRLGGALRPNVFVIVALTFAVAAVAALARGPRDPGSSSLATRAARTGEPVLAEGILGQQVALAGGRTWVDNPLDAFTRTDQQLYVDWLGGQASGDAAIAQVRYVLVRPGSAAAERAARDPHLARVASDRGAVLYRVATG